MSGRSAIAVGALTLMLSVTGCAGGHQSAAALAVDQRYVDGVHNAAPDIAGYRTDSQVVKMGHVVCDGFRAKADIEQIAGLLERTAANLPAGDIGAIISTAVNVLCPAYAGRLNPVAPGG